MIKHCLYCGKEFKAKPSGAKYCCYPHYAYDNFRNKTEAVRAAKKHLERSLPALSLQARMDMKKFREGDQKCQNSSMLLDG